MTDDEIYMVTVYENFLNQGLSEEEAEKATQEHMENRGVVAHSSLTQTTELRGQFFNPSVKNEFLDYLKMQQTFAGTRT